MKASGSLIPLNIPGTYAIPASCDGAESSTTAELIGHIKLPTEKPTESFGNSCLLSHRWYDKTRIVPRIAPQPGKTHFLRKVRATAAGLTSLNWSGCTLSGAWIRATGQWAIPTVTMPPEPAGADGGWDSSSWVGLDLNDVLQAGVQQRVDANGQASYIAWYEWFVYPPNPPCPDPGGCDARGYPLAWIGEQGTYRYIDQANILDFPVSAGQTVIASIEYTKNKTKGYVFFGNVTTGQHFAIELDPPPGAGFHGKSAEWIMEAPDGEPVCSLPRFTPVVFTNGLAYGKDVVGHCNNGSVINIENPDTEKVLSSVSLAPDTVTINFTG